MALGFLDYIQYLLILVIGAIAVIIACKFLDIAFIKYPAYKQKMQELENKLETAKEVVDGNNRR